MVLQRAVHAACLSAPVTFQNWKTLSLDPGILSWELGNRDEPLNIVLIIQITSSSPFGKLLLGVRVSASIYFSLKTFHELVDCFCVSSCSQYLSMPIHSWSTKPYLRPCAHYWTNSSEWSKHKLYRRSVFGHRWQLTFCSLVNIWLFANVVVLWLPTLLLSQSL